jgi:uroporphyrinogen-III decarboxylase
MCTGNPRQVENNVRELINIFADNGGLIIDASVGIPDEAKPENVQALTDTVPKFN